MENRNYFTERDVERLETQAVQIRQDIISMIHSAKAGPAYRPMIKTALSAQAPTFIHLRFLILIPPRIFINRKAIFHVFFIFNSGVFLLFHDFKLFLLYSSYHLFYFSTIHTAQDVIFLHKM